MSADGDTISYSMGGDDICRACLARVDETNSERVFSKNNKQSYSWCTRIEIFEGDGLPEYLCKVCCTKMSDFYQFAQRCKRSHYTLAEAIKQTCGTPVVNLNKNMYTEVFDESIVNATVKCEDQQSKLKKIEIELEFQPQLDDWACDKEDSEDTLLVNSDPLSAKPQDYGLDKKSVEDVGVLVQKNKILTHISNRKKKMKIPPSRTTNEKSVSFKECRICKTEVKLGSMKQHLQEHQNFQPLHHCNICQRNFKSAAHFERHDDKNFVLCQVCGKSVFAKNYEIHLKRHNKEKDFSCTTCGQKFYQRSLLRHHELDRHMGRKYTCDYCKKEFVTKFAIRTHIYRHSETPRFKCNLCDKAYKSHWIMTLHKRTHHTGVLPYKCDFCQRGFANKSHMLKHRVSHTGERSYVCEYCSYAYAYKASYSRHLKRCKRRKAPNAISHPNV